MNLYKKISFLFASVSIVAFTGCLKDKDYDNGKIQSLRQQGEQTVVSIGLTAASTDNHLVLALDNSTTDTTINWIPVQVGTAEGAREDVKVKLSLNPALIGNYNGLNGTSHDVAPSSIYSILNSGDSATGYEVTIPKGSNTGYLQIKIKPSNFLGFDYALGFQITSVPTGYLISSNLGTGVAAIAIKNEWDGVYSYKGYSLRAGDPSLTGNFSGKEMALVTAGATSVRFDKLALWGDGNGQISIDKLVLDIDKTVGPPYPVTISSAGGGHNAPGYNSVYDPATQTFFISFTWGAGPASRLSTDTLTYLRAR
jgi:hypothetical protein